LIKYRLATVEDLPGLLEIGQLFANECHLERLGTYDPESCEHTLRFLIQHHVLIVADGEAGLLGCAAAVIGPWLWNNDITQASEIFWWVYPEVRKAGVGKNLLEALEAESRNRGATLISMVAMGSSMPGAVAAMYTNAGYVPQETHYVKKVL
jgi:GNAT superfamily N-acetyltransferase